jgi:zinc protease
MKRFIPVLLLILISATTVAAQQTPPAPGEPKSFSLPEVEKYVLDNGLEVRLVPWGTVPKATIRLVVQTGNIDETPDEVWLADLMADSLEQGTTSRSAEELARALAGMGGSLNIGVGLNTSSISTDVLSPFVDQAIPILADVAMNPLFPDSELGRLKQDMLRRVSISRTQPQQIALEKFYSILYPDHPYGRIFPTEAMVEGYATDDIRRFWSENFGAKRSRIYVVGQFEPAAVREAIASSFGAWRSGSEPTPVSLEARAHKGLWVVDRPGSVQSTIWMGTPVVDPRSPDWLPLTLTNTLLGGYFSSRVTSNIREDKGYTYSPRSSISTRLGAAHYEQIADVTTPVTGASLHEIFFEIDRLQGEAPPQSELDAVRNYMIGTFVLQNSSRSAIINQLSFLDLHGLGEEYLETYVSRLQQITPEDVRRLAAQYIADDAMTIVVVGDRSEIAGQLEPYGTIMD